MMNTGTKFSLFAALALFATGPALAAVTCDPLQRGSLSGGVFTPGTADADTDYRMACRGEAGDLVTRDDLNRALEADGADPIVTGPDVRFVFDLDGVPIDFHFSQFRAADRLSGVATGSLVYRGTVRGDGSAYAAAEMFDRPGDLRDDLFVDSWANIQMTGGARGIEIVSTDTDTDKVVRARNFGAIVTEGEGPEFATWRLTGHGVYTRSDGGDAESSNEAGATVTTRGGGAQGVRAEVGRGATATATAINRGAIATTGDALYFQGDEYRSDGLVAIARGGTARTVNEAGGEISTSGILAWGMRAQNRGGAAGRAEASNSGEVSTTGAGSIGMRVLSDSGAVAATNAGSIVTRGEPRVDPDGFTRYAHGVWVYASSSSAAATNAARGVIDVHGAGAHGMGVLSDSGAATGTNAGTIVTRAHFHQESDGDRTRPDAMAITSGSGAGAATATNAAGGEIETHGRLARGMLAFSGSGAAAAVNAGAIVTHSSFSMARSELEPDVRSEWADDRLGARGIAAFSRSGSAAVTHTGSVTVAGDSTGIYAGTYGTGTTARVTMTGGRVAAGGTGVWIEAMEGTAEATFSDGARVVADDVALLIRAGSSNVTVEDSVIRGPVVFSGGEEDHTLTLRDGADVDGPITYAPPPPADEPPDDGRDYWWWWWDGWDSICGVGPGQYVERLVAYSFCRRWPDDRYRWWFYYPDGYGRMHLAVDNTEPMTVPAVLGVDEFNKRGAGTARLSHMLFSGSRMVLEEGRLELRGSVNLGSEGTVTVHDGARLAFLLGDITANPDDHGRLAAGSVTFQQQEEAGEPTIVIQVAPEAGDRSEEISAAARENLPQFFPSASDGSSDGAQMPTRILKEVGDSEAESATPTLATLGEDGEERPIGTLDGITDDSIPLTVAPEIGGDDDESEAAPSRGGGNDVPEIALGSWALLAFLFGSGLFDDAGAEEALAECADAPRTGGWCTSLSLADPGVPATVEERARLGGLETWTRLVGTDTAVPAAGIAGATAESLSIGMDARLAGGFRLGVAVTPEMTASKPWRPGVASGAALGGERFALRAGWRDGPLFADAELSRGRYESRATLDNPAVGGALSGTFDLVQQQARATAGARVDLGRARLTPALTPFAGTLRQDAWTAASAALTADVPGVSRRYSGVKAGLGVTSTGWLPGPGGLRWRPSLRFSTVSVDTDGPSSLAMRQSDRAGVLSFASRGVMAGLPRRVHGLAAAATAAGSGAWRLRLGYAGMEVDGEVEHGAGLHLRVRF